VNCPDEDELIAAANRGGDRTDADRVTAHLADCAACSSLMAELLRGEGEPLVSTPVAPPESLAPDTLAAGTLVGRFVILGLIGRGAMGEVYRAHDPQLDRSIAIKLLRAGLGETDKTKSAPLRLMQEARSMARVSHPHVIAAHEVGMHDDRVFLVMEWVDGVTLDQWLKAKPRPWRDVVRLFMKAGAGLAAAHEAGVLHRDFKPHNVMVTSHDEPRITDFGLARAVGLNLGSNVHESSGVAGEATSVGVPTSPLPMALTQTGALIGTPAYMPPEQMMGQALDARADQFSFCATFWEALAGERPYSAPSVDELGRSIASGRLRETRALRRAPRAVRAIVARGLANSAQDRWPSMAELLRALEHSLRRRREIPIAIGIAVVGIAVYAGWKVNRQMSIDFCATGARQIEGVWNVDGDVASDQSATASNASGASSRNAIPLNSPRNRVQKAFVAAAPDFGLTVFTRLAGTLDNYVRGWQRTYSSVCQAKLAAKREEAAYHDRVLDCLEQHKRRLRALVNVLEHADRGVTENATVAVQDLPKIESCEAVQAKAKSGGRPKGNPARIDAIRSELLTIRALIDLDQIDQAARRWAPLEIEVRGTDNPELWMDILELRLRIDGDDPFADVDRAFELLATAISADRPDLFAEAATWLLGFSSFPGDWSGAERWNSLAKAAIAHAGSGHERLESWRLNNYGYVLYQLGRYDDAIRILESALALKEKFLGLSHPDVAITLGNLANAEVDSGRTQDALAHVENGLAILTAAGPAEGFTYSRLASLRAFIWCAMGRAGEAEREYRRLLSSPILIPFIRPEILASLAEDLLVQGRSKEALPLAIESVAISKISSMTLSSERVLAKALYANGRREEAVALAHKAAAESVTLWPAENQRIEGWLASLPASSPRSRVRVKSQLLHHGAQGSVGDSR